MRIEQLAKLVAVAAVITSCGGGGGGGGSSGGPNAPTVTVSYGIKQVKLSWEPVSDATFYRVRKNPDGSSGYSQLGPDTTSTTYTDTVSVHLTDWPRVRYIVSACNASGCSDSKSVSAISVPAIGYFKASNANSNDQFGAVAVSGDGKTVVVGAPGEASSATGINGDQNSSSAFQSGAAYVFALVGNAWVQQAYLKASNTNAGDFFGNAVALSTEGNTLIVAASDEASNSTGVNGDQTSNSAGSAGAVYVFSRNNGTWSQQAYLKASNTRFNSQFGYRIAISGDGNTVAARSSDSSNATGINGDQNNTGAFASGAVYVFVRASGTWSQQAFVKASNTAEQDEFGFGLSLSGDGNTLAVGADREDSAATGVGGNQSDNSAEESGAVFIFARNAGTWSQQAYIKASNTGVLDMFGHSVALSGDGTTLAVGAPYEDSNASGVNGNQSNNSLEDSGAAYIFVRNGTSWAQQAYLKSTNQDPGDLFGYGDIALSSDGRTVAVGAYTEASSAVGIAGNQNDNSATRSGAVYLFTRSGTTWEPKSYVKASNTRTESGFGLSFSLSSDASTLAVGAPYEYGCTSGIAGNQANLNCIYTGAMYLY